METIGELLSSKRKDKKISLKKVAHDLLIKEENLEALENSDWDKLPEPPFVKGFIKNYAQYLGFDWQHALALYRREYDESKYPKKAGFERPKGLMFTPNKLVSLVFILAVLAFVAYLVIQYLSILSAPKLELSSPSNDQTLAVPYVMVQGQTEKKTTVAVNGDFIPVDENGKFSYQFKLEEGQNIIEIVASKRLSPKSRITRIIRLSH